MEPLESRVLLTVRTWDGGGNDGLWASPANWTDDVAPADGDTVVFDGTAPGILNNNTDAGNSYTLAFTAGGYTVEGNRIALDNADPSDISDSFSNTINTPLTLDAGSTFDIADGSTRLGGWIDGSGSLTKTGIGELLLGGAATYTGSTNINAGAVKLVDAGTVKLDLTSGVAAYYTFNTEGNLGQDSGPNANHLKSTTGTPAYSAGGRNGGALYLNGATTMGTVSGEFPIGVPTGAAAYTVSALIKPDLGCALRGGWIGYGSNAPGQGNNFRLNDATDGVLEYWYSNDYAASIPGGSFFDGQWHSVVGTWDGTTQIIYIDGVNRAQRVPTPPNVMPNMFVVGKTTADVNFKGWLDDLLIVNRALSSSEVQALGNGSLPDTSQINVATGAILDLNNRGETIGPLAGEGSVALGSAILTVNQNATTTFSGVISGSGGLTKTGTGTLALSGAGTSSINNLIVDAGTLAFSNGTLNVAGVVNVANNASATLDISSGNLNLTGPAAGGRFTVGNKAGATGTVNQSDGAVNTGAGELWVSTVNSGTGVYNLTGGTVTTGSWTVVGRGGNAGSVNISGGTWSTTGNNFTIGSSGGNQGAVSVTGSGKLQVTNSIYVGEGGTGTLTVGGGTVMLGGDLDVGRDGTSVGNLDFSAGSITVGGAVRIGGANSGPASRGTVVQSGAASLSVSGGYFSVGASGIGDYTLNGGSITFTGGSGFNVGDRTGSKGNFAINGGTVTVPRLFVGKNGTAVGAFKQTAGTVTLNNGGDSIVGGANAVDANAYGYLGVSGGTMNILGNFQVGAYGRGVMEISGTGAVNHTLANYPVLGRFAGGVGVLTVSGGAYNHSNAGSFFIVGEVGSGTLNVTGGSFTSSQRLRLGHNGAGAAGYVNLNGGAISAPTVDKGSGAAYFAFGGGTLKATSPSSSYFQNLTSATIYAGGGTIDNNGNAITVAQPLLAPVGNGVASIPVATGGAGYLGTPQVSIAGGGGSGASAIAIMSGGTVSSIQITSPGSNYTSAPTVTLVGGGATTAATLGAPTIAANSGGGLTKAGAGTLILSGASTYAGPTAVQNGAVQLAGGADRLPQSTIVTLGSGVSSGTLDLNNQNQTLAGLLSVGPGPNLIIDGTNDGALPTLTLDIAGGDNVFNGVLGGIDKAGFGLIKSGAGTLTLESTNFYTGPTVLNAGTFRLGMPRGLVAYYPFDDSSNLGLDAGPFGNDLVNAGAPAFSTSGRTGGALSMNGTANFVKQASTFPTGVPTGGSAYTISAWVNPAGAFGLHGIVGWGQYGSNRQVNALRMYSDTQGVNYWWGNDLQSNSIGSSLYAGDPPAGWHHVVATYDPSAGANQRRIYVDGVLNVQGNVAVGSEPAVAAANFAVGSTNYNEFFSGLLDEIAIFDRALTLSEIQSLGSGTYLPDNSPITINGTATLDLNGHNETVGPLAGDGNVTLGVGTLTVNSTTDSTLSGKISGGGGLTKIGSRALTLSGPNDYSGTTTISGGALVAASNTALGSSAGGTVINPMPAQPLHRYSFNESGGSGTALVDSIGGANATIVEGGVSNAIVSGGKVTLSGGARASSDYVSLPDDLLAPLTDATIEVWATQLSVQNWSRIFDFGGGIENTLMMSWTMGGTLGSDRAAFKIGTTETNVDNIMQPYAIGQQFHIAMTIDDDGGATGQTRVRLYKDGAYRGFFDTSYNLADLVETASALGRSQYGDNTANASYEEFRIYGSALSDSQITASFAAGPNAEPAASLVLDSSLHGDLMIAGELITANGFGGGSGAVRNVQGNNRLTGAMTLSGDASVISNSGTLTIDVSSGNAFTATNRNLTIGGAGNLAIADPISLGAGSLTKVGAGTVVGTGEFVYSGGTRVEGGTLQAGDKSTSGVRIPGTVTLANGATLAISHNYDYAGLSLPNITGDGNLRLLGQNTGYFSIRPGLTTALNYSGRTTLDLDSQLGSTWKGALFVEPGGVGLPATTVLEILRGKLDVRQNQTVAGLIGSGGIVTTDSSFTPTLTVDVATGQTYSFAGTIGTPPERDYNSAGVNLAKNGQGTQNLTGNSNHTGITTVNAGTLLVNGTIASATTVKSGATLGGTGAVNSSVSSAGTIDPGEPAAVESLGTYSLTLTGGQFRAQVGADAGTNPGVSNDVVNVTGSVTLGNGVATLNVTSLGTNPDAIIGVYTLIANDGADATTGKFAGLNDGDVALTAGGRDFKIFYNGGDGNDVVLVSANGTPGTLYVNDQWTAAAMVDGDLENAGVQTAYVGIDAFASVADALATYTSYSGPIVVNGGSYASALLAGGGNVTLRLVRDVAGGQPDVALQTLSGDAGDVIVTRYFGAADGDLSLEQGTFAGTISGSGALSKTTAGLLVLTGANTYTGATTISEGTLQIGNNDSSTSVGASSFDVAGGATLVFSRNADNTKFTTQSISGAGDVVFRGQQNGYFTFRAGEYIGSLAYTGQTIVELNDAAGNTWYQGTLWLEKDNLMTGASLLDLRSGKMYLRNSTVAGQTFRGLRGSSGIYVTTDQGVQKLNLNVPAAESYTYAGVIGEDGTGTGNNNVAITKSGPGTQVLAGGNTYTGTTTVTGGTLQIGDGSNGSLSAASAITLSNSATLALYRNNRYGWFNDVAGDGHLKIQGDSMASVVDFQAVADLTYIGDTIFEGGYITCGKDNQFPPTTVLRFVGGTSVGRRFDLMLPPTPRVQTVAGVESQATGDSINFVYSDFGGAAAGLILNVPDGQSHSFGGVIGSPGFADNNLFLEKAGPGTQVLGGANTFTGPTTVSGGALIVNGTIAGSPTTVRSGATLGGTGSAGVVTVEDGGHLAPGLSPGTQNYANLTLAAGANFDVDLWGTAAGSGYDQAVVSGAVNLTDANLNLDFGVGAFAPALGGTFRIIDFTHATNSVTGTFAGKAANSVFTDDGNRFGIRYDAGTGNDVVLTALAAGLPTTLYVNDNWSTVAAFATVDGDLELAGAQTAYMGFDAFATIADALAGYAAYAGAPYAGPIVVNGGTYASADLSGGGSVTLQLVPDLIASENDVTVQSLTGDAADSVATAFHGAAGNLVVNASADAAFNGTISGSGGLTKQGTAVLILGQANSYQGGTSIFGGSIRIGHAAALGAGTVTIDNGGNLLLWWNTGSTTVANDFVLRAMGTTGGKAAIYGDGGGAGAARYTLSGTIALDASSNIGGRAGNDVLVSGKLTGAGGLSKNSTLDEGNTLILTNPANDYAGATTVSGGMLKLGASEVIPHGPGKGAVTVNTGAKLDLSLFEETLNGLSGGGNVVRAGVVSTGPDGAAMISTGRNYVQKLDFGNGGGAAVNGVTFNSAGASGTGWALTGAGVLHGESGSPTGYAQLVSDFYYNGNPGVLTFTGLTVGHTYQVVLYTQVGHWADRPQNATFANGGDSQQLLNTDPGTVGYYSYQFVASASTASISMAATTAATFHWFGASLELVSTTPARLTVGDSGNYQFDGVISGATSLVKQGAGEWVLSNANSYTGATTVAAGSVRIQNAAALSSGDVTVADAANVLLWWKTGSNTLANNFSLNGMGSVGGKDAIFGDGGIAGYGTYVLSGNITLNNTSNIGGNVANHLLVTGRITGAGGLTKGGARTDENNTLTLANPANDYQGPTTVAKGTLATNAAEVIPDGPGKGAVTVQTGTVLDLSAFDETINSLSGGGSIIRSGQTLAPVFFTTDAGTGISSTKTYTHALDFPSGGSVATINGVVFSDAATSGVNWNGLPGAVTSSGSTGMTDGGGMHALLTDFYYGGNPATMNLTGLTAGTTYELRLYNRAWTVGGDRNQLIRFDEDGSGLAGANVLFNEDASGTPNYLAYRYTAVSDGIGGTLPLTVSFNAMGSGTYHFYGLTNEVVASPPALPTLTVGDGSNTTFSGSIGGRGNIVKQGSGAFTLAGNNTYAGATTVNAGALRVADTAIAHYTLEGNGNDASGKGHNLAAVGSPGYTDTGRYGQAIALNGSSQYMTVPYAADLGLNSYTVSLWVQVNSQPAIGASGPALISTRNGGDTTFDLQYTQPSAGNFKLHADIGSGSAWLATAADCTLPGPLTGWNMITYTVASSGYVVYVNGAQVTSGTLGGSPLLMKPGQTLSFGAQQGGGTSWGSGGWLNASLDEIAIFDRVLNASAVTVLYQGSVGSLPATTPVLIADGATLDLNGVSRQTVQSLSDVAGAGGAITSSIPGNITLNLNSTTSTTFSGVIQGGSGQLSLVKTGDGTQSFSGPGSVTLDAIAITAGTVDTGPSMTVNTADFSAGTGTVNTGTDALTITNRLKLADDLNAVLTGGTSFTVGGSNVVVDSVSTPRTLTLSGGTLAWSRTTPRGVAVNANSSSNSAFSVSNSDLLTGLTGAVANNTAAGAEGSGGPGMLTNGLFGTDKPNVYTISGGTVLNTTVTYALNSATCGYDITGIDVYGSWVDSGRENPNFNVAYATYSDPLNFVPLPSSAVNYEGGAKYAKISLTAGGASSLLASGVVAIRFNFPLQENGYVGYAELDVFGTATAPLPVELPNTNIAITASSALDLGMPGVDHTLGALAITASGGGTVLSLSNAGNITFRGISALGAADSSAAIVSGTGTPVVNITSGSDVHVADGVTLTVNSVIGGTSSVNKTGAGTLVLSATNIYTGPTAVNEGTLQVDGQINSPDATVSIVGGAVLLGQGTVTGLILGAAGSTIQATGNGFTLGNADNTAGFDTDGALVIGQFNVTLLDANVAVLGSSTTLAGGTLNAANGASMSGGDLLSGYGTINGRVAVNGGTVTPGTPIGTLAVNGNLVYAAVSTFNVDVTGTNPGTLYDQIRVSGDVTAAGTLNTAFGAFTPADNDAFRILDKTSAGAVSGTFAGLPEGEVFPAAGKNIQITYQGGDGNDVVLRATSVTQPVLLGTPSEDTFVVRKNGGNVEVLLGGNSIYTESLTIIQSLRIDGMAGSDSFTVDFAFGGWFDISGGITIEGGAGQDQIIYTAADVTNATHTFNGLSAGSVDVDGSLLTYNGTEPITDNLSAVARVFNFLGGAETIVISDDSAAGMTTIDSTLGETLTFANPSASMVINSGSGDDLITITSIDPAFRAATTILGDADTDTVEINGSLSLGSAVSTGNLSVTAETVLLNAAADTTAGTVGNVTFDVATLLATGAAGDIDAAGNVAQVGAGAVQLGGDVTAGGSVSFAGAATLAGDVSVRGVGVKFDKTIVTGGNDFTLDGSPTGNVTLSDAITGGGDLHVIDGNVQTYSAITMSNVTIDDATTAVTFAGVQTLSGSSTVNSSGAITLGGSLTAGGTVNFLAGGDVSIDADLTGGGDVTLIAGDDNSGSLSLSGAGTEVKSTAGNVVLRAGDDLTIPAGTGVNAAGTITIEIDAFDADTTGNTLNLAGTLVAATTNISGGDDADVINLDPQAGSPIQLDGRAPVGQTGDRLNLDLSGLQATLSIAGTNNRGRWTFSSDAQQIDYQSIEQVTTFPEDRLYGLRLDMEFAGFHTGDRDVILVETSEGGTKLKVSVNGGQVYLGDTNSILAFDIVGSQDTDVLDYSNLAGPISVTILGTGHLDGYAGELDIPVAIQSQHLAGKLPQAFDNIDELVGSAGDDTLTGSGEATTWMIESNNAGTVIDGISAAALNVEGTMPDFDGNGRTMAFSGIENLTGGGGNDWFALADGAGVSGRIGGNGGNDTLDYRAYATSVRVDLTTGAASGVFGGLAGGLIAGSGVDVGSSIENVFGGLGDDRNGTGVGILGDDDANVLGDGPGSDVLAGGLGDDRYVLTPSGSSVDVLVEMGGHDTVDFSIEALTLGVEFDMDLLEVDQHVFNAGGVTGPTVRLTRQAPAPAPSPFENFIGSRQADIVWIDPLSVLRAVEGNDPTSGAGDRMNFEASGSVVQDNGAMLMASGIGGVYYTEIERIELYNAAARTIDNGDTGWNYSGAWVETAGPGYLGDVHLHAAGATADVASWTFDGVTPGEFVVSITWPAGADRTSSASVRILDGAIPLWSGTIDQRTLGVAEADFVDGGVAWVDLDELHTISGHTLRVELTDGSGVGKLAADAVRIERVTAGQAEIRVIEAGTKQDIADGTGSFSFGETPKDTSATRTFVVQNLGTQPLVLGSLTLPDGFAGDLAAMTIAPGLSTTLTVTLNADVAGQFAGQLLLQTNDSNESPFDFRLSGTVRAAAATANIVDIGDDGFSVLSGQWRLVPEDARYFNEDHLWNEPGPEVEQVQWLFTGLDVGSFYRVSATWLADPNRSTAAPYTITSGTTSATTIDQQRSPSSYPNAFQATDRDGREYWFADLAAGFQAMAETLAVRLTRTSVGYVIADAVRVEKLMQPEISLYEGEVATESAELRDGTSVIDFGATELGRPVSRTFTIRNVGGDVLDLIEPIRVPLGFSLASSFQGTDASSDAGFQLAPGSTATFIVQMNGQAPGPLVGVVAVTSDDADESPFEFTVTGAVGTQIIDDGDPGFQLTAGTWYSNVQDPRYFEHDHRYATAGTGTAKAVWQFTGLQPGATYQVSATWLEDPNRATNAPYRVRVDGVDQGVVRVNQQLAPADFSDEGAFWEELGAFTLGTSGTTIEVELFNDANGYVIADGMRIQHVYLPEIEVQVDADGRVLEDGRSEVDFGTALVGAPAVKTFRVRNLGQLPLELLTLSLSQSIPAGYELASPLSATTLGPNDAQPGGSDEATFVIRQLAGTLGKYSGTVRLVSTDMDESPLEFTVRGEVASNRIIDNDTPGFSSPASTWRVGATHTGYFASTHRYHARTTTAGAAVATWTFTNLQPGEYKVYATWMADFNRATDAKYTVSSGDQSVPATVNQRLAPQGLETWGDDPRNAAKKVTWKLIAGGALGAFVVPDTPALTETLTVSLKTSTLGYVIADAVRLEYDVSPLKAEAAGTATLPNAAPLTTAALAPLVEEAQTRWSAAGLGVSQRQLLSDTRYVIADLGGRTLALASPATKTIYVDDDAAGHGWFVDATPSADEEYPQAVSTGRAALTGSPATGKMDLLTAVLHEMGHLLGKPDLDASLSGDDLMSDRLPTGTRRAPHDARDALFAVWDE